MANEEWRILEVLKLLRQCVVCPHCGVLVATQAGIDAHINWHNGLSEYVANVDQRLESFSDYIINPATGLQKQIQDRLDTITNYVTAPETGLEPRITVAITELRNDATAGLVSATAANTQLRNDATAAINGILARLAILEA